MLGMPQILGEVLFQPELIFCASVAFKILATRDRLIGAVASSLGLVILLLMNINMEVIMSMSIDVTAQMSIMPICLAMGTGFLGMSGEPPSEESVSVPGFPS